MIKILTRLAIFAALVAFIICGVNILFHPTLHMDESYYIGSSLRILSGDIFLTTYKFDKPFLLSFFPLIGILILGYNAIGFKLMGLVFSLMSIILFIRVISLIWKRTFLSVFLVLGLFCSPLMISHGISAFAEPFLLFFLFLFFFECYKADGQSHKAYQYFTVALFIKFSAVMWGPVLLGYWLFNRRNLLSEIKYYFASTKWIWGIGIFFMLTNRSKFAPVSWFGQLYSEKIGGLSFVDRAHFWIDSFAKVFGATSFAFILFLVVLGISVFYFRKYFVSRSLNKELFLIVIPFWLHLIGILFSGSSLYERYLVILLPQLILVFVLALKKADEIIKNKALAGVFVSILPITLMFISLYADHRPVGESQQWGRLYHVLHDEFDRKENVLHNINRNWELFPYSLSQLHQTSCGVKDCLMQADQMMIEGGKQLYLEKIDDFRPVFLSKERLEIDLPDNLEQDLDHIMKALRFKKSRFKATDVKITTEPSVHHASLMGWHDLLSGSRLSFTVTNIKNPKISFTLSGLLSVTNGRVAERSYGSERKAKVFRLDRFYFNNIDVNLVDIAPVIWNGYSIAYAPFIGIEQK